jgi:hypothetical protein
LPQWNNGKQNWNFLNSCTSIAARFGEPRIGAPGACAYRVQQRLASIAQSGLE